MKKTKLRVIKFYLLNEIKNKNEEKRNRERERIKK